LAFLLTYVGTTSRLLRRSIYAAITILLACSLIILNFNGKGAGRGWWMQAQFVIPVVVIGYAVFMLYFLVRRALQGQKLAVFYLAAIGILAISIFLQIGYYVGSLEEDDALARYGVPMGYIIESIILTAGLVYRFNRYRLDREDLLREIHHRQQENVKVLIRVQEAERSQIANQLHDVAGSLLSTARINLSSLLQNDYSKQEARERLQKTEEAVALVSDTVRDLSHALSPVMLDKIGLKKALEKAVSFFNTNGKLQVELAVFGFDHMDASFHTFYSFLYGVVYELLNNATRHSGARHVLVQLVEHQDTITLVIEDDGIGINKNELANKSNTLGLTAIQSKVKYYKGNMAIERNLPNGSIITIEVPKVLYEEKDLAG
jgi:signal transduction histidine kinase